MKKSQTRPEIQGGLHPINTGKYMFLTTAINELSEQVNLWVSQRTTGAMIVGDQRLGKTRARVCIKRQLLEIYPQIPVIEIPCRHEKNPTERNFFMHLLECADHSVHEIKRRDSSLLRHRLNEYLKAQVEPSPQKLVIFLLDDAQTLSECQYTWLMDIHNEMNNVGIHLGCYLFGQKELIHQRTAFRMANKHQLIARFMLRSFNFHGIRNFDELLYCLKGYDETECPPGSGWSFTRYFFPESFNDGWRVISLGETLWNAFFDASKSETKTKQIEIPMEFFVRVINQFFLENKDRNVLINPMTFTEIMKIIENTGFYEFRDGIPSEILHDSGSK